MCCRATDHRASTMAARSLPNVLNETGFAADHRERTRAPVSSSGGITIISPLATRNTPCQPSRHRQRAPREVRKITATSPAVNVGAPGMRLR